MLELVTKQEAYEHLRLDYDSDGSADDGWLDIFIPAVSEAVSSWIKVPERLYDPEIDEDGNIVVDSAGEPVPALDSSGLPTVRRVVKAAVLLELASQYRFHEGEGDNVVPAEAGHGYVLSKGATALLVALRKNTVA